MNGCPISPNSTPRPKWTPYEEEILESKANYYKQKNPRLIITEKQWDKITQALGGTHTSLGCRKKLQQINYNRVKAQAQAQAQAQANGGRQNDENVPNQNYKGIYISPIITIISYKGNEYNSINVPDIHTRPYIEISYDYRNTKRLFVVTPGQINGDQPSGNDPDKIRKRKYRQMSPSRQESSQKRGKTNDSPPLPTQSILPILPPVKTLFKDFLSKEG